MKRQVLLLLIIGAMTSSLYGQFKMNNDSFKFRIDTAMNYTLNVLNNDTSLINSKIKIMYVVKYGNSANYNIFIQDSTSIIIKDTFLGVSSAFFTYFVKDSLGNTDSARVFFSKLNLAPEVYPGDANRDSIVNHFDLFPIGLMYGKYGEPRHNLDTNISFLPRKVNNWLVQVGGVNGKHADIDGNSTVDSKDIIAFQRNLGFSTGIYNPRLSPISATTKLFVNSPDTISVHPDSTKIRLPLSIVKDLPISSYGLGYTYSVTSQNVQTSQDTAYNNHLFLSQNNSLWGGADEQFVEDRSTQKNKSNIAYCKTNLNNGGLGSEVGIVEVVVDVILGGIIQPDDFRIIKINLEQVALIDNEYNLIPISPVSKTIYLRKDVKSGTQNSIFQGVSVYPTSIEDRLIVEKTLPKSEQIWIYNALGQPILHTPVTQNLMSIQDIRWPSGFYYLKVESTGQVFKLYKQ